MEANRKRYVITDELIQTKHLVPFWIFLIIGWTISAVVFVGERCIATISRLKRPMISSYSLPNSTVQFIEDAFKQSVRTLYLVDLNGREWFESFLQMSQPLPKVILGSNRSIALLDESCLAVLYLEVKTYERLRYSFEMYFDVVPQQWKAKLLVLIDDTVVKNTKVLSVLDVYFKTLGIAFWCVTGERHGITMRGATPLRDYFSLQLNWLRAFGYMDVSRRRFENSMEINRKRYVITDELIQTKHLVPFWIFLFIGWSISAAVFVGERCIGTFKRFKGRAHS
uniref:Uncharacterized protein n=1 Tax=Anopheles albimanus TaxID=7167 RepID=A0A182F7B3_ANOAL